MRKPVQCLRAWNLLPGFELDLVCYSGADAGFGRHHHDSSDLSLVLRGTVRERVGRRNTVGQGLFSCFKQAGLEHSDHFEGEVEVLRLRIEPSRLHEIPTLPAADIAQGWKRRQELSRGLLQLAAAARARHPLELLEECIHDLLALLSTPTVGYAPAPPWMSPLEEAIEDRVAADTGFSDQAHLTRLLKAECAFTPAGLRRLGRRKDFRREVAFVQDLKARHR